MLMTVSAPQADRARALRATGASVSDLVRHKAKGVIQQTYHEVGFNYRLTDIQAAIGLVQLGRLDEILRARAMQARYYDAHLSTLDEIQCPHVPADTVPCFSSYCVKIRPGSQRTRDEVLEAMAARNISCRRGIPPLYKEPYFRPRYPRLVLPISEEVERTTLFLPIYPGLTEGEQARVVASLKQALVA
jgi:dTDP-4-amino-4,6-dideoxygalactose transaminase